MIEDFDKLAIHGEVFCDLCIVGSGPAGLAIADAFAGTALNVLVLETGGEAHEPAAEALSEFESVGQRRAHHMSVRRRIFGGTSVIWSGRCVPFSPMDFQQRSWIPLSGWPIDTSDVQPYLDRAGRILGLGPAVYDDRLWRVLGKVEPRSAWDATKFEWQFFQASLAGECIRRQVPDADDHDFENLDALKHSGAPQAADVAQMTRTRLERAKNVRIWLHAHARHVLTDESGKRATGVVVGRRDGGTVSVKARSVVLACGGIDNARLLLLSDQRNPGGLGNARDQVGRYLMDHHYAAIAQLPGDAAKQLRRRLAYQWFDRSGQRHVYLAGLSLSAQRQQEDKLTRGTLYLFEHTRDPAPVSSLGGLLRSVKDRRFSGIRREDVVNVARHPVRLLEGIYDRYVVKRPALTIANAIDIGCNVEQVPNPASRVSLSSRLDKVGQRMAQIDWRVDDLERETYAACARLFASECQRLKFGSPVIAPWLLDQQDDWRSRLHDMAHPMGTTRMSSDPAAGVVDRNCAVHGVENLYIAGSSVFSTAGTANPTLLLVSLAIRLADHLHESLRATGSIGQQSLPAANPAVEVSSQRSSQLVRIGIIGAGDRVQRIYLPVLKALGGRAEVVGFTCRQREKGERAAQQTGWDYFASITDLVAKSKPQLLIVAVSGTANAAVVKEAIHLGIPILAETPIAWDEQTGRTVVSLAANRSIPVGVAEQFPFLPAEQLKRKLIDLGVLGEVTSVVNAFASFDYHGLAQLRAYLGERRAPLSASAVEHDFGRTGVVDDRAPPIPELGWPENWLLGAVKHDDGALLVHQYSSGYSVLPTRPKGQLLVHGRCGSLVDDTLSVVDRCTGGTYASHICREYSDSGVSRVLRRVFIDAPGVGEVEWRNPYTDHVLDDEQIAVACHVEAMLRVVKDGGWPLYSAAQALKDIELLRALSYSARLGGSKVSLPLDSRYLKFRLATSPQVIGRVFDRVLQKLPVGNR